MSNFGVFIFNYSTQGALLFVSRKEAYNIMKNVKHGHAKMKMTRLFYSTPSNSKKSPNEGNNFHISPSKGDTINQSMITNRTEVERILSRRFEEQTEKIPDKVRQIMRHIPQSIAILTTCTIPRLEQKKQQQSTPYNSKNLHVTGDGNFYSKGIGMTLSSVSTVTLQPEPIISFNIKKPSHTLEALKYHGHFLIHFPSCSKAGALLANTFSRGGKTYQHDPHLQEEMRTSFDRSTPLTVLNVDGQKISLPALLPPNYPVNYVLKCEVYDRVNGYIHIADHMLVVGKVQKTWCTTIASSDCESTSTVLEGDSCLAYIDGAYCSTEPISTTNDN
ncbi:Uncharacterized protein OnM2_035015 [Erysiphe neolycopersici]|uniref:Flavin reductase like domain-containing protein n=1 Tax=Erysiphe neolycopersici TaxID=212602 RepID=A0A420HXM6_9PEZI|nr:Uncharacterized protein OnM2_035015 [Erysiphe neolycopersici]